MKKIFISLLIGLLCSCDYPKHPAENYKGAIVVNTLDAFDSKCLGVTVKMKTTKGNWEYRKFCVYKTEFKYGINDTIK